MKFSTIWYETFENIVFMIETLLAFLFPFSLRVCRPGRAGHRQHRAGAAQAGTEAERGYRRGPSLVAIVLLCGRSNSNIYGYFLFFPARSLERGIPMQ